MKKFLLLMLLFPSTVLAQKFYIKEIDKPILEKLKNRISYLGYTVTENINDADFVTELVYEKKKGYMSMKSGYHKTGFIRFQDAKGVEIGKTQEQGGRAYGYNTYSALATLFKKILKEDFDSTLKVVAAGYKPSSKDQLPAIGSKADELAKLKKLLDDGTLTKEEFESEKKKILEKD